MDKREIELILKVCLSSLKGLKLTNIAIETRFSEIIQNKTKLQSKLQILSLSVNDYYYYNDQFLNYMTFLYNLICRSFK